MSWFVYTLKAINLEREREKERERWGDERERENEREEEERKGERGEGEFTLGRGPWSPELGVLELLGTNG